MRDIYYQSTGNPLQTDRLPASRPTMQFANLALAPRIPLELIQVPAIAMIIGGVVILLYRSPGMDWMDPYDLLLALPVILTGLSIGVLTQRLEHALHPAVLLALGVVCLNHRVPWSVQTGVMALGAGLLVFQFGRHSVAILTTPPMPREQATEVRATAAKGLAILAVTTTVVTWTTLWCSLPVVYWASLVLLGGFLFAPAPRDMRVSRMRVWHRSLISWYTYAPSTVPGLLQSPAGSKTHRMAMLMLAAELTGIALVCWDSSPLPGMFESGARHHAAVSERMEARQAGALTRLKHGAVTWVSVFAAMAALPAVIPILFATAITTPLVCQAAAAATATGQRNLTQSVIADLHSSPDLIERNSIYLGRMVADGSPVLVPRSVFGEHAHGLGDSGCGKTSLFLCPLIEQLLMQGDCSMIVIDLKADTLELLAALTAAADFVRRERGIQLPIRCFSNQQDRPTCAFNPMTQSFWSKFDLLTRTDILCGANGLTYGTDYGAGYFSSANASVLFHALKAFPNVSTFQELADAIGTVITTTKKRELHPEIRKAGVHVHEVIKRLANCRALNVTAASGCDPRVLEQSIDLTQPFLTPQLLYFHLSATLSPSGAPEIGRLVNYMLLAASTQTVRRHPVYLVIDEFQRMVASNLEYMLQLARSMGVGVILANQSMEDLRKSSVNLIPAVEANCRLRQWFSVSSSDDQERLIRSSGETVDLSRGRTYANGLLFGPQLRTHSENEQVVPRITMNDLLLTSDHPFRSILKISRGSGYAQYGGFPAIIESSYHISESEYSRRRAMCWPSLPGMLPPASQMPTTNRVSPLGPTCTEEIIGTQQNRPNPLTPGAIDKFLDGLKQSFEPDSDEDEET